MLNDITDGKFTLVQLITWTILDQDRWGHIAKLGLNGLNRNIFKSISTSLGRHACCGIRWLRKTWVAFFRCYPDSKAHGANMGLTWVLSAPDGLMLAP